MVTICCFSSYGLNNPLIMTHYCSNDSISIVESITLVNARDFAHYAYREVYPSVLKQRESFTDGGSL